MYVLSKINRADVQVYNIAIYGNRADAAMLAYFIDKKVGWSLAHIIFNVTMIQPPFVSQEEGKEEIDRRVISFCGVEKQWMRFLDDSNLQYQIKQYGIYFGEMLTSPDKNQFSIYSTEEPFFQSLAQYGLSKYAAQNFFLDFARKINQTGNPSPYKLEDLSTLRIVKNRFPSIIKEDGVKYFSEELGLDPLYIKNFILPVIWGNYLHETNSLSSLYKLLPTFCYKRPQIGQSLVLFENPNRIRFKLLKTVKNIKINYIKNKVLQTYMIYKDEVSNEKKVNVILTQQSSVLGQNENQSVSSNQTLRTYLKSDIFFIFDNIASPGKAISYYKTIVDGKIKDDHLYEQFFTIYLKYTSKNKEEVVKKEEKKQKSQSKSSKTGSNPIFSITRVCAYNCKGYESSAYILISKHKLSSTKVLNMFEFHNIKYYKKEYMQASQYPSNKKLREHQNVYKIYDIDGFTDSYELQMDVVQTIAEAFVQNVRQEYL